jgi:hypothetical protein
MVVQQTFTPVNSGREGFDVVDDFLRTSVSGRLRGFRFAELEDVKDGLSRNGTLKLECSFFFFVPFSPDTPVREFVADDAIHPFSNRTHSRKMPCAGVFVS